MNEAARTAIEEFVGVAIPPRVIRFIERRDKDEQKPPPPPRWPSNHSNPGPPSIGDKKSKFEIIDFDTPLDLLSFIREQTNPWDWQSEELEILGGYLDGIPGRRYLPTDVDPLFYNLAAANGSGKDAFIIAPFAVWFCITKIASRCVITSASYEQLKHQTFKYIVQFCEELQELLGEKLFDIVEFHVKCRKSGGEIKCFVTDEEGKAEGFHPDPRYPGAEMAFIANEAKSIDENLWRAFSRFSGYNYWLEISSPGGRSGHFHETCTDERTIAAPESPRLRRRRFRRVSAFECPHITEAHIEEFKYRHGEHSALYKMSILSEFAEHENATLIGEDHYDLCFKSPPREMGSDIGIGLDLAAGGDENACFVRRGNKIIDNFFFHQKDTRVTCRLIDARLAGFKDGEYVLNVDNGGVGSAIVDGLVEMGWNCRRRNNQSPAGNKTLFTNLGAEMYYHTKRLIERRDIIIPLGVTKLRNQLTSRRVKGLGSTQGKMALQSKPEAKAEGMESPDRGDAFVLAYFSYSRVRGQEEDASINDKLRSRVPIEDVMRLFYEGRFVKGGTPKRIPGRCHTILDKVNKL